MITTVTNVNKASMKCTYMEFVDLSRCPDATVGTLTRLVFKSSIYTLYSKNAYRYLVVINT